MVGTLVFGIALLFVWQSPADAHVAAPVKATNDRTEVLRLEPQVAGVRVRLVDGATRLELRASRHRVVVLGYQGEPYLRIDDRGVYENVRSPATYLNTSIKGALPPAIADPKAAPRWERVGDGPAVRWHDHALHVPPGMKLRLTRVSTWQRPITVDGRTVQIVGRITRESGRSRLPWLAVAALVAIGTIVAARRRWAPAVLAVLAIVMVADAARVAGLVLYAPPWLVSRARFLFDLSVLSIVGWGLAVSAAVLVRRRRPFEAAS
ncbi:MAG: dye decolorizing peroxidase, partial [Actinomycetota bacterium]|nr:dye decolorizing peroxidase [Actinomycetota bacterium]